MTTPKTGRPRGAPPKDFLQDPERYAINYADARMALGVSENDAFAEAAALWFGKPTTAKKVGPRRKQGRGNVPAGWQVTFERDTTVKGSATIQGKAATLRKKAKAAELNPEAAVWRTAMLRAYVLALTATNDYKRCASIIMELADMVGETLYADDVLLPLLEARLRSLSDS